MNRKISNWLEQKAKREQMGGVRQVDKQHAQGKLTVRERVNYLLDEGSFQEYGMFVNHRNPEIKDEIPGDALVSGFGTIDGRPVYVYGADFTCKGGSFGENTIKKMNATVRRAITAGVPLITLNDGAGGRIQGGVNNSGCSEIFYHNVLASGWIPQISAIMGPCAGGTVYSPALTDFVFMVKNTGNMYLTGPNVIKQVMGEDISKEALGGCGAHAKKSGTAQFVAEDDYDCLDRIRELLSYLPQNAKQEPPVYVCKDDPDRQCPELDDIIPEDAKHAYDMHDVIRAIVDDGEFMEPFAGWAQNAVTALARMNGRTVGIFANQPKVMAGCLDLNASDKAARFIRFCDCFNIPLIYLADTPGYLPGVSQEHNGIIRHGAKLVFANAEATVPQIVVILNKFYGGAKAGMCCSALHSDYNFFWPTGQSAVMGAPGAVAVIHKKEIEAAPEAERAAVRQKFIDEYTAKIDNPFSIMENFNADEIIRPSDTRRVLCRTLELLAQKQSVETVYKKHANMPL